MVLRLISKKKVAGFITAFWTCCWIWFSNNALDKWIQSGELDDTVIAYPPYKRPNPLDLLFKPQLQHQRGTDAMHYSHVKGSNTYYCASGERYQAARQYDDNYCDCGDGSDEPNTNACVDHIDKFHCKNGKGVAYHSMIDDGICDCCDGSDEPYTKCEQTCT